MKVNITVFDPVGNKLDTSFLDDLGKGVITIGNESNANEATILRLDSTQIDKTHAQLVFGREISASPFERQHDAQLLVCHLIVLSERGNVYRADHSVATPFHEFIPWYRGDAYLFGDYTLLFDRQAPPVPFVVNVKQLPANPMAIEVEKTLSFEIDVATNDVRVANVEFKLENPSEFKMLPEVGTFDTDIVNIDAKKTGKTWLRITIPKDLRYTAGDHTFILHAQATEYEHYLPVEIKLPLRIVPYYEAFRFEPQETIARIQTIWYWRNWWRPADYWFRLANLNNTTTMFDVNAKDNGGKSRYFIEQFETSLSTSTDKEYSLPQFGRNPQEITLQPGEETEVRVLTQLRGRRHVGLRSQRYVIDIAAAPQGGAQPTIHKFDLWQRPLVPSWLSAAFFLILTWLILFLYTPRITPVDLEDLKAKQITPHIPITVTWSKMPFVIPNEFDDIKIISTRNLVPTITKSTSNSGWFDIRTTNTATITFPEQDTYTVTVIAKNSIFGFGWPFIGGQKLGLQGGRIYGQDTYTTTANVYPTLQIDNLEVPSNAKKSVELTLSYTPTSGFTTTVDYIILNGSAQFGKDFVLSPVNQNQPKTGTVTFTSSSNGSPLAKVSLEISPTLPITYQQPITFTVILTNPRNTAFPNRQLIQSSVVTIKSSAQRPKLTFHAEPVYENTGIVKVMALLSSPSLSAITFNVSTKDDLPEKDRPYLSVSKRVEIKPGETSTEIDIPILDNSIADGTKSFNLEVANEENVDFDKSQPITVMIFDDEQVPTISIDDVSAAESDEKLNFTISVSPKPTGTVSVHYAVQGRTALVDTDFPADQEGNIKLDATNSETTLPIAIINDTIAELPQKTLIVVLSKPSSNAVIGKAEGIGTINDDDGTPKISFDSTQVTGSESTEQMTFKIKVSPTSAQDVRVHYQTVPGTATAGSDFEMIQGTLTITAGQTENTVSVKIIKDNLVNEPDETLTLQLSNPEGAELGEQTEAVGTIIADSTSGNGSLPILTIKDAAMVAEGSDAQFAVELDKLSAKDVTFFYSTINGTAQGDIDFKKADNKTWTIPAGTKTATLTIKTISDIVTDEDNKTFIIKLSNVLNAIVTDSEATGTIADGGDGTLPIITITNSNVDESGTMEFSVTLDRFSAKPVTVQYSTSNVTATAGSCSVNPVGDYERTSGILTFAPGSKIPDKGIQIPTCSDNLANEGDEKLQVMLSSPTGATFINGNTSPIEATGTILDKTDIPLISIVSSSEGNDREGGLIEFSVALNRQSATAVSIRFLTKDGTGNDAARAGTDYIAPVEPNDILTIPSYANSASIFIQLKYNRNYTGNLRFAVDLLEVKSNNAKLNSDASEGVGTIIDAESAGVLGKIQIIKKVVELRSGDDIPSQDFTFNTNFSPNEPFVLNETFDNKVFIDLQTAEYTFEEQSIANWDLKSIECNSNSRKSTITYGDNNKASFLDGDRKVQIDLSPSDYVVCTFTNRQQTGSVQITKTITKPDGINFQEPDVKITCTDTSILNQEVTFNDNGAIINDIPIGSQCTVLQDDWSLSEWYKVTTKTVTPQSATINQKGETIDFTVTNTIEENPALLTVCIDPEDSPFTVNLDNQSLDLFPINNNVKCTAQQNYLKSPVAISETVKVGTDPTAYSVSLKCGTEDVDITKGLPVNIKLNPGSEKTCTYKNTPNTPVIDLKVAQEFSVNSSSTNAGTTYQVQLIITITNGGSTKINGINLTNIIRMNGGSFSVTSTKCEPKLIPPQDKPPTTDNKTFTCDVGGINFSNDYPIVQIINTPSTGKITSEVMVTVNGNTFTLSDTSEKTITP